MKHNVPGLILNLELMPKVFTDTPLSKNQSVAGCDQKDPKPVIIGLNQSSLVF